MVSERKDIHTIDTRFTWSGNKAKDFIKIAMEEYGDPLPYGAIRTLIRLACAKFVEAHKREIGNEK